MLSVCFFFLDTYPTIAFERRLLQLRGHHNGGGIAQHIWVHVCGDAGNHIDIGYILFMQFKTQFDFSFHWQQMQNTKLLRTFCLVCFNLFVVLIFSSVFFSLSRSIYVKTLRVFAFFFLSVLPLD